MKTIIVLTTLVLFSCKPKLSERDNQVLKVLEKDLNDKELISNDMNCYFNYKLDDPRHKDRTKPWYQLQFDLMIFYNSITIDTFIPYVDSINNRIVKINEIFNDKVNKGDKSYFTPLFKTPIIKDSLDFLIFKNEYLSKVLDLRKLIASQLDYCDLRIREKYYINDYNSMKESYKFNDTLKAQFLPSMFLMEQTLSEIKLYCDKKLIYQKNTNDLNFNYGPLTKGNYELIYSVFSFPPCGPMGENVLKDKTYYFEVK